MASIIFFYNDCNNNFVSFKRCIQRLRSNRSRLVDKFRGLALGADGTIDVVMKEEWESFSGKQNDLPRIFGVDHKV